MREVLAGLRLQSWLFRRNPGYLLHFMTIPFFSAIFLSGVEQAGKTSLLGYAIIGPAMIGLWVVSLDLGGSIINLERMQQTFELQVIVPGSFTRVLLGRVLTITGIGMFTFVESVLFARLAFGVDLSVAQPVPLALTLVVTAVAMAGTSTAMAAVFVASRDAPFYANALGYPFYILGGVVVPVTFLPLWVRPLSWLTYLYWSSALLRGSLTAAPISQLGWRLLAVIGVGVTSYTIGLWATARVIDRLRRQGTVGLS
ncbi:MAG TPA: ABC transporter permease [Streptosporangiaceae bacterium]|nr:ABC transporter permease [Streptosporangiaceae bacterium]